MALTEEMVVRVPPELRAEIERAAAEDHRSRAGIIREALFAWSAQRAAGQEGRRQ
jgi:hypothetical protein